MLKPPDHGALTLLLDSQPEAQLLIDGDGRLLHANRAAATLLGRPAADCIGLALATLSDAEPEALRRLLQQGARSPQATPGRLSMRMADGALRACRVEIAALRPRQALTAALLWLRLTPSATASGRFLELNARIAALAGEIDRRRTAERELQRQREWLQVLLRSIGDAVIATDTEGRVVFMNPVAERLTGWPEAEASMHPLDKVFQLIDGDSRQPVAAPVHAALREGRIVDLQPGALLVARDGSELPLDDAAAPIVDERGQLLGAVLVFREIGERLRAERARRELETQLREAQKLEAIGTLAGGIAHDFNNMVGSVLANAGMLQLELPAAHPAQPMLQQISIAGQRARELVRKILSFGRRQPQQLRRQALQPLIDEAVGLLRGTLPSVLQLELRLPDAPVLALVDGTQLQQVLLNLCTNAWHALQGSTGLVRIRLSLGHWPQPPADRVPGFGPWQAGPYALIEVDDDGCGMDPATRRRIFEPFFTTKPRGQGTGLGLAVAHGIVAEHRGAMAVRSTPGEGSCFGVYLPLLESDGEAARAPAAPLADTAAAPQVGAGRHVAYIDDDEVMLLTVEALLQRAGFRVSCFGGAAPALAALDAGGLQVDIVVSDFNMPQLSGLELAQQLQRVRPGLPVVISSGYISAALRSGARAAGVARLLNKEETFERIAAVICEVLQDPPAAAAGRPDRSPDRPPD